VTAGIFTDNGKRWEHSRALLRPQFARDNIADLAAQEVHVQNIMRFLEAGSDGWTQQTDLSPIFFRLTLDSATEFLFGQSVGSQLAALPGSEKTSAGADLDWVKFGAAFTTGMKAMATKFRLQDWHWLYTTSEYRESIKEIHRFADHWVNRALESHRRGEKDVEDGSRKYVFAEELAQATQDPIELRNQLLHILLAGRDTTSGMLGWLFYELALHPGIYDKLRKAVLEDFGTYQNPKQMDFASLKACTYLQRVMNETLRVFPIVPFNSRMATQDTTLPVGGGPDQKSPVFIQKGMEVNYAVHMMHQREDLYGPDAAEFKPDRWESRKSGWEYLPFK
jgi:cytochrome P450